MSKGWGRRPMAVEREAYDSAWERTFSAPSENGVVVEENANGSPAGHPEKPLFSMDPCDVANVLEPEPTNWRRA